MIREINGLLYEAKSPALFELKSSAAVVQVGFCGPVKQWAVRMLRDGNESFKSGMTRDEAFGLIAKGFGIKTQTKV